MPEFIYEDLLPIGADDTEYRLVSTEGVSTFEADGLLQQWGRNELEEKKKS